MPLGLLSGDYSGTLTFSWTEIPPQTPIASSFAGFHAIFDVEQCPIQKHVRTKPPNFKKENKKI